MNQVQGQKPVTVVPTKVFHPAPGGLSDPVKRTQTAPLDPQQNQFNPFQKPEPVAPKEKKKFNAGAKAVSTVPVPQAAVSLVTPPQPTPTTTAAPAPVKAQPAEIQKSTPVPAVQPQKPVEQKAPVPQLSTEKDGKAAPIETKTAKAPETTTTTQAPAPAGTAAPKVNRFKKAADKAIDFVAPSTQPTAQTVSVTSPTLAPADKKPAETPAETKPAESKAAPKEEKKTAPVEAKKETAPASPEKKKGPVTIQLRKFSKTLIDLVLDQFKKPVNEEIKKLAEKLSNRDTRTQSKKEAYSNRLFGKKDKKESQSYISENKYGGSGGGGSFNRDRPREAQSQRQDSYQKEIPGDSVQRAVMSEREKELMNDIKSEAGRWLGTMKEGDDPKKQIEKDVNANLNKLTPDNYDDIAREIYNIAKESKDSCEIVCNRIINKAWNEQKYCKLYANLCDYLCNQELSFSGEESKAAPADSKSKSKSSKKTNDFRKILLSKLQGIFEESELILKAKKSLAEMDEQELKNYYAAKKKKIIGNVNFLAELAMNRVMQMKIIKFCTYEILEKFLKEYTDWKVNGSTVRHHEDTLEALLKLYSKVGKMLEESKEGAKEKKVKDDDQYEVEVAEAIKNPKAYQEKLKNKDSNTGSEDHKTVDLDNLFQILLIIREQADITERVKLLVKNLEGKRADKWAESEVTKNDGPMTIEDLHQKYIQEQEDQEALAEQIRKEQRGGYQYTAKPSRGGYEPRGNTRDSFFNKDQYKQKESSNVVYYQKVDKAKDDILDDLKVSSKPRGGNESTSRVSEGEAKEMIKGAFKTLEKGEQDAKELSEELLKKADAESLLKPFLNNFADGKNDVIEKRYVIGQALFNNAKSSVEDLSKQIGHFLLLQSNIACDFPPMPKYTGRLLAEAAINKKINYKDIVLDIKEDDDAYSDVQDYISSLINETKNYFKANPPGADVSASFEEFVKNAPQ